MPTVLQLSDTHLCARPGTLVQGADPDQRLAVVLEAARAKRFDLVLLTGDDADDASVVASRRLAAAVGSLGAPVLALPGNHDSPASVAAAFGGLTEVEIGSWRIVCVDSSRPMEVHGTVDVASVVRRLDDLDDRPTALAIHHPPRSPSTNEWFRLDGGSELLAALASHPHVRLVLSGHLHLPFEIAAVGGLTLLGAPSTLVPISHDGDAYAVGDPAVVTGARLLDLHEDGSWSTDLVVA